MLTIEIITHNSEKYHQAVDLRTKILRAPLNLVFSTEELALEKDQIHIAAFENDQITGILILVLQTNSTAKIRQVAVDQNRQGKGTGRALVKFAENYLIQNGYNTVTMHARKSSLGFYEKLGYKVCSNEFFEVSIPHYKMQKSLG